MDSILSMQNKIFTWVGESLLKLLEPSQAPKVVYTDNGIWESMWGFVMESAHVNTSSIRDKWHRWKSRSTGIRRYVSSAATVGTRWKVVVWLYGMLLLSAKCARPRGRRENSVQKTIWRTMQRENNTFGAMVEYHPSSPWEQARIHQFGWLWAGRGGIFGKDILIADLEDLEKLDASDIYPRRINAKEILIRQNLWWIHIHICRWDSKIVRKRLRIPRTHSKARTNGEERRVQWRNSWRTRRVSTDRIHRWRWSPCQFLVDPRWLHLPSSQWTSSSTPRAEGRNIHHSTEIHWCNKVYSYWSGRHARETCRWLLECRFEQKLVRFVEGFTKFTPLKEKPPEGCMWDWQRFKRQPDQIMYGQTLVKPVRIEKNKNGTTRRPKLDNARRLSGIYFIDPDDQDYKETLKIARRKLERPMAATMPCKRKAQTRTTKVVAKQEIASKKIPTTINGCIVESHDSTRQRAKSSRPTKHKDHIADNGFTSMTHYNLVHNFILVPQTKKIPDAKAAVDKEWKKLETIPAWQMEKVKSEKEVILEAQRDKKKVHMATLMDICHLENAELEPKSQKLTKAEACSAETL